MLRDGRAFAGEGAGDGCAYAAGRAHDHGGLAL